MRTEEIGHFLCGYSKVVCTGILLTQVTRLSEKEKTTFELKCT